MHVVESYLLAPYVPSSWLPSAPEESPSISLEQLPLRVVGLYSKTAWIRTNPCGISDFFALDKISG